ncbi:hypothetical protein D3C85_1412430 [compost metagenome]
MSSANQVSDQAALHQGQRVEYQLAEFVGVRGVVLALQLLFLQQGLLQRLQDLFGNIRRLQVQVRAHAGHFIQPAGGEILLTQGLEFLSCVAEALLQYP